LNESIYCDSNISIFAFVSNLYTFLINLKQHKDQVGGARR